MSPALRILSCIALFSLGLTTARPAVSPADTYTGDFERRPHANTVAREGFNQWATKEQDRYRLRVEIPDALPSEEEATLEVEAENARAAAIGRHPRGEQPESHEGVAYAAILMFSCVLGMAWVRPDLRAKYFHPWELLPATWRRKQQQACAPRDTSRKEVRRLAKAMEKGAGPGFLDPAPEQLNVLARIIEDLQQCQDPTERQELLVRGYLLTHALTPVAEHREPGWQIRHSLEGLLKKLLDQPVHATATAFFTAAKAVEVLKELRAAGPLGEAAFAQPIRILAVYDDPVTCHVMAGVLQSVFGSVVRAADGESAMAFAAEQAFDVVFMDSSLRGIDGYAVCAMLRQIAMHHDTPVVLMTDNADDRAVAEARYCGGNDLISKPLLPVEVTLKALILALRYRLAGGGGTPENATKAFETRLLARGDFSEPSGVICGTSDTQILRVVRRK